MSKISRRRFFQFTGSAVGSIALSQVNQYGKLLAQNTSRKVALLVGINKYKELPLKGCINDVEMQRYLLIHRFGFNPKDIYTLTDEQATRESILAAFEEYLIKQVKPGDVVVYHFSGHGSRVRDPDPVVVSSTADNSGLNSTFVPIDSGLPAGFPQQGGVVQDIMGHTLYLLMSAVKSENFTAVLDSCHSGGATRQFTVRSRAGGTKVEISPQEKAYQEKWLSQLNLSRENFINGYRAGVAKGVVLAATKPQQLAVDAPLNGFHGGMFTYLLTQYLWQENGTAESAIANIIPKIPKLFDQTPIYEVKVGSGYEKQLLYFINNPSPKARGVVTEVKGNEATLWLGGIELGNVENGQVFTVIDDRGNSMGKVTFQSRQGLLGKGTIEGVIKSGMWLQSGS